MLPQLRIKKVQHLKNKNIISYCIDDPNRPYKGVRDKGTSLYS